MDDTSLAPRTIHSSQKPRNVHTFSSASYLAHLMGELDRAAIAQRIGQAMREAGITQPELGEALEPPVHWRTIQTWQSVKKPVVPWGRLDELARVLGVTKEWLLHGEETRTEVQGEVVERLEAVAVQFVEALGELRTILEGEAARATREAGEARR